MDKLDEILEYYENNHTVLESLGDIKAELIENDVEIRGNSFFCPIWNEDLNAWLLLAGTKDKADMWVLKKILKLIKSGDTIISVLNGNVEHILSISKKYNVEVLDETDGLTIIRFNNKGE